MSKVIGIDFDDVIVDTNTALAEFHNKHYGTNYTRDQVTRYDFSLHWGIEDKAEHIRRFDEYVESAHHTDMQLVIGVDEALATLRHDGWEIVVVTSRPKRYEARTRAWVSEHLSEFDDLIFTSQFENPESTTTKAGVCTERGAQVFVEDSPHHADELSAVGIPVLLFDTPWNQEVKESERIIRIKSWSEALAWIKRNLPN